MIIYHIPPIKGTRNSYWVWSNFLSIWAILLLDFAMWRKKKQLKLWTVWSLWQREREWVRGRKIVRKGHPRQKIWAIQKGLMILYPSSETSAEVWIFESSKIWKARVFLGGGKYGIRRFVGRQNPATPMGKKNDFHKSQVVPADSSPQGPLPMHLRHLPHWEIGIFVKEKAGEAQWENLSTKLDIYTNYTYI